MSQAGDCSNNRWSLRGMTALVTGGSKGIGFGIVEELASLGASVYTCGRSESQLNESINQWKQKGFQVSGSVCDVSSQTERESLIAKVSSHFDGKLNILINNVGTSILKPTLDFTSQDFSFLISTNLESAFNISQLAHPLLKASGNGSIVFVSSLAGVVSINISGSIYSATKGAINQLTKYLACEWADDSIRTNCVAPSGVKTPSVEPLAQDEKMMKVVRSRIPLRRIAEVNEISSVVAFLCLPASSYITGQMICVDGGLSANSFTVPLYE